MVIPPDSKPRSNRSLKRARVKKKKAAAAATAKNGARQKPLPAPKQRKPLEIEKPDEHFAAVNELLKKLIQSPEISEQFDPQMRTNTRMVYTKGVTLWMLILQRLGNGLSLEETVSHIIQHDRDLLPENKRVREGTLSENSSGYYKAKKTSRSSRFTSSHRPFATSWDEPSNRPSDRKECSSSMEPPSHSSRRRN